MRWRRARPVVIDQIVHGRSRSGSGGTPTSPIPDFLIAAHAAVLGCAPFTRGSTRYRTYYPAVRLVAPERE